MSINAADGIGKGSKLVAAPDGSKSVSAAAAAAAAAQQSLSPAELLASMQLEANTRQTHYNLMVCCVTLFCAEASRGLFIPSLWSCVQHIGMEHSFLSWCIPLFSVGRMFGSYLAGRASDRWNDDGVPTLACLIASILGGAIYVMADMHRSWLLLLLAEFTMGLGGGTLAVLRAHVSKITTDRERMSHTTYISTAQFVGLGLMPLAALAINYAFVGQHHRDAHADAIDQHNLLLATATGMMGDALSHYTSLASSPATAAEAANTHFLAHYRSSPGGRRNKHPGLENSAASRVRPPLHGGRHLLSSAAEATTIGGSVAAAAAIVAPAVIPTGQTQDLPGGADGATFLARFFNHRTAPALLLIALNLGCMLLYFMYFEARHQSLEFQAKKAVEAAKKQVEQAVQKARKEGREFDADNEIEGQASAFAANGDDKEAGSNEAVARADTDGHAADASSSSSAAAAGGGSKKKPKELIFDLSKLDALNMGGGAASDASSAAGADASATASAAHKPSLSIVQVSDTTVIVLKPFASDVPQADSPASSRASAEVSHRKVPVPLADADLEMDRRGAVGARGASGGSSSSGTFANLMAGAAGVASAVTALFKHDAQSERAAAASKGSIQSGPSAASSSSSAAAGFDGGQRGRIAAYESGHAGAHDLDNEGVPWGPFLLTPERMVLWGSCLFVYLNYTIRGVLATVETVGTPTLARFRHIAPGSPIEVEVSATFFGLLGLLGCLVFFLQWLFQDRIDEPTTLIAGFAVTVLGSGAIVFAPGSEAAFTMGCVCIWSFGLPAVQNSVLAALSRILGTRPQGTWMGWIQTFGSLGRVTFPLITKFFSIGFAFGLSMMSCLIAIILLIIYIKLVKKTM